MTIADRGPRPDPPPGCPESRQGWYAGGVRTWPAKLACRIAACTTLLAACVPALERTRPDAPGKLDWEPGFDLDGPVLEGGSEARSPDQRAPDVRPADKKPTPDAYPGQWYQANQKDCSSFCTSIGKVSAPSPEGATCMSGEDRPASGVAAGIKFPYGCWSDCSPQPAQGATSCVDTIYCYRPGQDQDADVTDFTVGCFCR